MYRVPHFWFKKPKGILEPIQEEPTDAACWEDGVVALVVSATQAAPSPPQEAWTPPKSTGRRPGWLQRFGFTKKTKVFPDPIQGEHTGGKQEMSRQLLTVDSDTVVSLMVSSTQAAPSPPPEAWTPSKSTGRRPGWLQRFGFTKKTKVFPEPIEGEHTGGKQERSRQLLTVDSDKVVALVVSSTQAAPSPPPEAWTPSKSTGRRPWWLQRFGFTKKTLSRTHVSSIWAALSPSKRHWAKHRSCEITLTRQTSRVNLNIQREDETPIRMATRHVGPRAGPSKDGALPGAVLTGQAPLGRLTEPQLRFMGLPNLANSCSMNATLQSLMTLRPFSQEMEQMQWAWSLVSSTVVMREFVDIMALRRTGETERKRAALKAFKNSVALQAPDLWDSQPKESNGFLSSVLNHMESLSPLLKTAAWDLLRRTYTCPVQEHLLFHMRNTRTCRGCEDRSLTMGVFTKLSLFLEPEVSVSQALDMYLTESDLEFSCKCGSTLSGIQNRFQTLPNVLVLHLKRRSIGATQLVHNTDGKVLLSRDLELHVGTEAGKEDSNLTVKYKLVSVLSHVPSQSAAGHYISEGAYQEDTDQWLCFDDMEVSLTTGSAVCHRGQHTAEVVFYQRQGDLHTEGATLQ